MMNLSGLGLVLLLAGCASMPKVEHKWYQFPPGAYLGKPEKPYQSLGWVRSKVNFTTLDPENDEQTLCKNYFNKAVRNLLRYAKKEGGEAVIQVESVVFHMDGSSKTFSRPECYDDGAQGQVLARGIAVRFLTPQNKLQEKPSGEEEKKELKKKR